MKIVITGSAKEIAALVLAVQGRQKAESLTIGGVSTKAHGNDLIVEHGQNIAGVVQGMKLAKAGAQAPEDKKESEPA